MVERVDYHVHYDAKVFDSGFNSIDRAIENNVTSMVLLAHLSIVPYFAEYQEYGRGKGVEVFTGVETHMKFDGKPFDIICIGFDPKDPMMDERFGSEKRKARNAPHAAKQRVLLENKGYRFEGLTAKDQVTFDQLMGGEIDEKAITFCRLLAWSESKKNKELIEQTKASHHNLWEDIKNNYADNYRDRPEEFEPKFLYCLYFAYGQECYTPPVQLLPTKTIIKDVHNAGGVVLYSPEDGFNNDDWEQLLEMGVDGIMGWHAGTLGSDHGNSVVPVQRIIDARRRGLLVLGGSDYKGENWQAGVGDGTMYISKRRGVELKQRLEELMKNRQSNSA